VRQPTRSGKLLISTKRILSKYLEVVTNYLSFGSSAEIDDLSRNGGSLEAGRNLGINKV
jgi:hypothetical protein